MVEIRVSVGREAVVGDVDVMAAAEGRPIALIVVNR